MKTIDLIQYTLFLAAVIVGLFVNWKISVVLFAIMIIIAMAKNSWND